MSLQYVRYEFVLCPTCAAKPGSPALCRECLERRELRWMHARILSGDVLKAADVRICERCAGTPHPECPEHGR